MKGYNVSFGYMGFLPNYSPTERKGNPSGAFIIFATEEEYKEIYNEIVEIHNRNSGN